MNIRLTFFLLLFPFFIFAHSGNPKYHIVIDTDGAIDDMRAISMFLAGNDIRVLAITCSQGTLMPRQIYPKVQSLLTEFHHEGIRTGVSDSIDFELPAWSNYTKNVTWSNDVEYKPGFEAVNAVDLLNQTLSDYTEKVTLVALGSLKTYADWLKANPQMLDKIDRILWYNSHDVQKGFNYKISPASFDYINQLGVDLEIIANNTSVIVNSDYLHTLDTSTSRYARQIAEVHQQEAIAEKIKEEHLQLWDDMVPLYLNVPVLFETKTRAKINYVALQRSIPDNFIYNTINELLVSSAQANNMVFERFPTDTHLYMPEYAKMLKPTLSKYGAVEWKAITMTNEIHGHTGIYSIIGAKMGVRIMDYFNIGVNNLYVTSYAGLKPPLSCFNDGIQISTGATIGQGLITVSDSISEIPSAMFEFNGQKIVVSVKKNIAKQMQKDIVYGVKTYGALTEDYWSYIEELAIKYWADYNRNTIFDIKKARH